MDLVDVHAHVVPHHFPESPQAGDEPRWPCMCHEPGNQADVQIAGRSFRKIDHRSWDTAVRIADMDEAGVARQALSPMPELLSYWFEPAVGLEMCRWMNATLAEMVAFQPARFSALGIVPLQDPSLASTELARLKQDGFAGVELGSNINGVYLGDPQFADFFAEAERLELAVFIHALHPTGADRLQQMRDVIPFAAFPVDTALCAMSLIRAGIPERHPNLRLGFSHGGGAVIPLAHRLGKGADVSNGFDGTLTRSPASYAADFFYDNLVYDAGYLSYLANVFAPGQVFVGTDYPYAIMETDPAGFVASAPLEDAESVRFGAAHRFLGIEAS